MNVPDGAHYDVVTVSDLRLPGGTGASIGEELTAQHDAGLRNGLVHVTSHLVGRQRPFNPRIRAHIEAGTADVLVDLDPVTCDLLVLRHPAVMLDLDPAAMPTIRARQVVLVANQSPGTPEGAIVHYDPAAVVAAVRAWVGQDPIWIPIGPLVRGNLELIAPDLPLADDDWVNIIDVDRWVTDRRDRPGEPIVIGRHSRDHPTKWPADAATIRAAYPEGPGIAVEVLGGASVPEELLGGKLPPNWTVHGFGELSPERFLAGVDVLVYYHHPDWVEAFGRTVLEALASGAVAVLPHHFRPLFGDACLYATPDEVERTVRGLAADPEQYRELSERGLALVRERFSYAAHLRRLASWLDRETLDRRSATPTPDHPPRILFVSSNGAGVGHLMRLMAMARRATVTEPLFLTLSQAIGVVHELGYPVEYLPSRQYLGGGPAPPWHALLRSRLARMVDEHDIRAIVFDGTWPYEGLLDLPSLRPDVQLVWSRRAMWKPGITSPGLDELDRFSLVLEPGEYAADADRGITRKLRHQTTRVAPIMLLDPDDRLDRPTARARIGLDPDRPAALIQLGAGNINDTSSLLGLVVERLTREPDLQVCVTRSAIASATADIQPDVVQLSVYPLARYLAAFDLAVAAPGYNTYHELVATPVPTLFVPNLDTATDDQLGRARHAERLGVARCLTEVTPEALDAALAPLLDPDQRERLRERAAVRIPRNGAAAAMAAIERLVVGDDAPEIDPDDLLDDDAPPAAATATTLHAEPAGRAAEAKRWLAQRASSRTMRRIGRAPFRALPKPAQSAVRRQLRRWDRTPKRIAGTRLPVPVGPLVLQEDERVVPVMIVTEAGIDGPDLRAIVELVAGLQTAYRGFAPLFVTHGRDVAALRSLGYAFEYLPAKETWPGSADAHERYLADRLTDIARRYEPRLTIELRPGDDPRSRLVPLLRALA